MPRSAKCSQKGWPGVGITKVGKARKELGGCKGKKKKKGRLRSKDPHVPGSLDVAASWGFHTRSSILIAQRVTCRLTSFPFLDQRGGFCPSPWRPSGSHRPAMRLVVGWIDPRETEERRICMTNSKFILKLGNQILSPPRNRCP